jgi:hypothetical protein
MHRLLFSPSKAISQPGSSTQGMQSVYHVFKGQSRMLYFWSLGLCILHHVT